MSNSVTIISRGLSFRVHGKVPVERLLLVASTLVSDIKSDAEFHAKLDAEQIIGAWDPDTNDTEWCGYDGRHQDWIRVDSVEIAP